MAWDEAKQNGLALKTSRCELGTRTTCNANLGWHYHQELTECELVSVFLQHGIELFDLGLEFCSWEPKENDAGVD